MTGELIAALLRHLLTGAGAVLATRYGIEGAGVEAIAGGAAALAGVVWSIADKRDRRKS